MSRRRAFLLRIEPELYAALQRWAGDELRSLNAQIEFLLRRAVRDAGRARPARETKTGRRSESGDPRS